MANITRLAQFANGVWRGVDLTSNTLVTLSVTVGGSGGTTLTQTILNNLVNLQNGTDFSSSTNSHTHNGIYYTQTQLAAATAPAGSTLIGDNNSYSHFTPTAATVKGALAGIDAALAGTSAITALTGDVTASGTGSVAATVAAIQGTTVSGTTGTGDVVFSASPTLTGTVTAAVIAASGNISSSGGTVSGSNLTTGGHASADLALAGGTMSGNIAMGGNLVTGLGAPTANGQALRFDQLGSATSGSTPGIATLDSSGKIPVGQLPSSVFIYQGTWNPNTNTPTLADGTGTTGYVYWVSAAKSGTVSGLSNSSMYNFQIGDLVVYNGSSWELTTPAAGVQSVNGSTGAVTVNAINQLTGDITAGPASGSASASATISAGAVTASKLGTVTDGVTLDQSGSGSTIEIKAGGVGTSQIASAAVTAAKLGAVTDGVTLDQSGSGSTIEIKAGGVGTTQLASSSVTAAKLGSITDGVTLDQSGTGSTLEVKAAGITETQIASSALSGSGAITGGSGSKIAANTDGTSITISGNQLKAISAPKMQTTLTSGSALTANTSYVVRWGQPANSETAGYIYVADDNASSVNNFYAIGIAQSSSSVSIGGTVNVVSEGTLTLGSSDTPFTSGQVGLPVFLTASGAFSTTAPTTSGYAVTQIGIVQSTSSIWVQPQVIGIN